MPDAPIRDVDRTVWTVSLAILLLALAGPASAGPAAAANLDPAHAESLWHEECGSCHLAYPARFLSAESWRALLGKLASHFGVDASVDANQSALIRGYLEANAGRSRETAAGADLPRITDLNWFVREHSRVPGEVWRRASIRSRANCGACHLGADRGSYSEHAIKIPN